MLQSIYFNTLIAANFLQCVPLPTLQSVLFVRTDVTVRVIDLNQRYDRCSRLQPTLQSVFLTYDPVTDVMISVLGSWPPVTF